VRRLAAALSRRWRAHFHRYAIDDPRPVADDAPYTYFLPSENELLAVQPEDMVKLIFRGIPPSPEWGAERMWVRVTAASRHELQGVLDNVPSEMQQLRPGDPVTFRRSDIIDLIWAEDRDPAPPAAPPRREYWERCWVDDCVLNDGARVHFLYREEPAPPEQDDRFPDSGWRIRGDYRDVDDDAVNARASRYIALGKVLNADDSWLHLIDAPAGSAFLRNWETDAFEADPD